MGQSRHLTVEFYEFSNNAVLTQHFGDGQDNVGCGGARWDFSGEFETNNAWHKHGNWLTKHGCFGFDTANTPAENTQPLTMVVWSQYQHRYPGRRAVRRQLHES